VLLQLHQCLDGVYSVHLQRYSVFLCHYYNVSETKIKALGTFDLLWDQQHNIQTLQLYCGHC